MLAKILVNYVALVLYMYSKASDKGPLDYN